MRRGYRILLLAIVGCSWWMPAGAQQFDESKWGQNSAGVELAAHEGPRESTSSGTMLVYNILGKGFPADRPYTLWGWLPGRKPQKEIAGVSFNARGLLVCSGKPGYCTGAGPNDPININTKAAMGQAIRFAVVSNDGRIAGFAEAIPFPIEAHDKGCSLSVIRQSPLADVVAVKASGFTPYEMLTVTGQPGPAHSPTASAQGTWQAIMGVQPPGQTSGTASLKVSGKNCSVNVSFPWGEGSGKPR